MSRRAQDIDVTVGLVRRLFKGSERLEESGCWVWKGVHSNQGYGRIKYQGRFVSAHRVGWCWWHGMENTPEDRPDLDHLCRIRDCWNPAHLEAVTCSENVKRGDLAKVIRAARLGKPGVGVAGMKARLFCQKGHNYAASDSGVDYRGARRCRECYRERKHREYLKRKEKLIACQKAYTRFEETSSDESSFVWPTGFVEDHEHHSDSVVSVALD